MSATEQFMRRFKETAEARGLRRAHSPSELVAMWEQFVGFVEDGYDDNIYEYDNDLSVRDLIEAYLNDEGLRRYAEMNWYHNRIEEIDNRFRAVLQPEPYDRSKEQPWWHAHVPRYAGSELAADFSSTYGVTVEER